MAYPKPESGALHGEDGTMLLRGSAGRLARSNDVLMDPEGNDRSNHTGLDHFSDHDYSGPDYDGG